MSLPPHLKLILAPQVLGRNLGNEERHHEEKVKEARKLVNRKVSASKRVRTKKTDVVEKIEIEPTAPVAPPVQAVETTTVTGSPQGTGV